MTSREGNAEVFCLFLSNQNAAQPFQIACQGLFPCGHTVACQNMGHQGSALLCAKAAGLIHRHGIRYAQVERRSWRACPDRIKGSAGELFDAVAASTMLIE